MSMARKIYSLDQQHLDEFAVNAIPGAEIVNPTPAAPSPAVEKYPTNAYLTHPFPPSDVVIELLDEYFASLSSDLFKNADNDLINIMDQNSISAIQTLILLGSDISPHEFTHNAQTSSPQEWWDAALRTSRITELPQLAQIATDSHLVAFLAINLFNSAIAMVVMALSDPLSDKAQEVKRITTRIFRLQDLFGRRSKLSMQSSTILKNVVQLLLRRENEAIFAPVPASKRTEEVTETTPSSTTGLLSVRETLNLPLGLPQDFDFPQLENNSSQAVHQARQQYLMVHSNS
ncbi:unnamed protein product [Aureobasidium pullulans]|nr:unnamed protein product [Aureobasidium pullulans]